MIVRWRGRNGIGPPGDADRDREQHGVHRLGHEEIRDPLDVGDDPPAFGNDTGHGRELPVEQHDLGHGAGRRRATAHRDPDVGVLQRECVVHTVARHRNHVTTLLQRGHDRPFLVRGHASHHTGSIEHLTQLVGRVGKVAAVDRTIGIHDADAHGHRADGPRTVARDDLAHHSLVAEVADRLGGVVADPLLEQHERRGLETVG